MFERFTEEARATVVAAQEEARLLRHASIGAEHLLLALATRAGTPVAATLARFGVTPDACRTAISPPEALDEADAEALRLLGIDLHAVRERAETAFGRGALDRPPAAPRSPLLRRAGISARLPFGASAKRALRLALREAVGLRSGVIGAEHVLLGVTALDDPAVVGLLRRLGTSPAAVRSALLSGLRPAA
ncbi:Clp protease N-terminal domain-containing protein [Streptomyces caatingaensis]|uniref:Clp R domain-containing protein n=1 Tax=Streptomyces caatingaensis TaxID=1678637 RepID=A0A0K9XLJ0_9ACTN|nr:Clp protease N-terminal domain-containing protein [Streptomyces caatingaensis]KNB53542.1 hypothetical protein AC230_02500 [Streptomyces caatingaensis]